MGSGIIIAAVPLGPLPLAVADLVRAAAERWGEHADVKENPLESLDANIWLEIPGQTFFQIDYTKDHSAIHCDGTDEQNIEVALWVRSLIPDDFPRVIVADGDFSCHVELVPGITEEQFRASVVDHSVPGWNDGDPDLQ
jgi:hypothetical protein